ncbi:leucine-rich repeat domain-containing protein [Microcoleus sp. D2_18a_D3]|uniref:leucine-rich repeat domain-containing protein n=1 Tax=Microcoleus sp. D2_18a_D3 TaxID=3055330 RepID=UPI002FD5F912
MLKKLLGDRNWFRIAKRYAWQCIVFSLSLILILGGYRLPGAGGQQTPTANYKTFTDWCTNKAKLKSEERRTVDALLEKAETNECEAASHNLSSLSELIIIYNEISDITPLTSLTNLTDLELSNNQISDITPLKSLTKLTNLNLGFNQISDFTPLTSLTKLTNLYLNSNQISDFTPLTSLTNLTGLIFYDNLGANETCPLKPESICGF